MEEQFQKRYQKGRAKGRDYTHALTAKLVDEYEKASAGEKRKIVKDVKKHIKNVAVSRKYSGSEKDIMWDLYEAIQWQQKEHIGPKTRDDVRQLAIAGAYMQILIDKEGARELGLPENASFEAPDVAPKKEEKTETPKKEAPGKKHPEAVQKAMKKHNLEDKDADEVEAFKKAKPQKGKKKMSPQELMQKFMQKAKPETKERMKGMSPNEFMAMLNAISEDGE